MPDTVSVTPVGKVVILGVEVLSCDTVTCTLPLTLPDLVLTGERVAPPLFDTNPERLTVREPCAEEEGTTVKVRVGEADCDLLTLPDAL